MFLTALLTACGPRDHYLIELTPKGDAIERRLIGWHESGGKQELVAAPKNGPAARKLQQEIDSPNAEDLPESAVAHLAKVYGNHRIEEGHHVFSGTYRNTLPDDLGNTGRYLHLRSSLGTSSTYFERIRGNDDQWALLSQGSQGIDAFTRHMANWVTMEFGDEPGIDRLVKFIRKDFKQDLHNIALYLWQASHSDATSAETDNPADDATWNKGGERRLLSLGFRIALYLIDRDYFDIDDLPRLLCAIDDDPKAQWALLRDFLARKLDTSPEGLPARLLSLFEDPESFSQSFERYLASTDDYRRLVEEWEQARLEDPELKKPAPSAVIESTAESMFAFEFFNFFSGGDAIELRLALPEKPFLTNGRWEDGHIKWSDIRAREAGGHEVPMLCHASWAVPDRKAQSKRFGKVILEGSTLAEYCLALQPLDQADRADWEEFLATVTPKNDPEEQLRRFRESSDAYESLVPILVNALENKAH